MKKTLIPKRNWWKYALASLAYLPFSPFNSQAQLVGCQELVISGGFENLQSSTCPLNTLPFQTSLNCSTQPPAFGQIHLTQNAYNQTPAWAGTAHSGTTFLIA